jgi:uncharacterized protein YajQ (UPF0234 family)
MADSSFDIVSKVDMQEVKNAVDQARREIETRFDFKGSVSEIDWTKRPGTLALSSDNETRMKALVDVLQSKFIKRGLDIKALDLGKLEEGTRARSGKRPRSSRGWTRTRPARSSR